MKVRTALFQGFCRSSRGVGLRQPEDPVITSWQSPGSVRAQGTPSGKRIVEIERDGSCHTHTDREVAGFVGERTIGDDFDKAIFSLGTYNVAR
ncbi:hypothetical protein GA830_06080 [Mesorhizobium sp. NBSH29]|uniref:hypothetical protein n=1 Tax=Mesorhizobium sp. NBSH29 TaxID=2654249 RepID=UPI0018966BF1|nr:hypothetical protein [Mesorhizobium sp. NBSH29]QPC86352.1 hypothetical protein GA830_06080 [Mesorhizobium sp. NBSH29]